MAGQTKITVYDNGPYLVTGPVSDTDADGNQYEKAHETVVLCRCVASTNKPFCDGTHSKAGSQPSGRCRSKKFGLWPEKPALDLCKLPV